MAEKKGLSGSSSLTAESTASVESTKSDGRILPDEILLHVFSSLDKFHLVTGARPVCRHWMSLSECHSLWGEKVEYSVGREQGDMLRRKVIEMRGAPYLHHVDLFIVESQAMNIRRNFVFFDWMGKITSLRVNLSGLEPMHRVWGEMLSRFENDVTSFALSGVHDEALSSEQVRQFCEFISRAPHLKRLELIDYLDTWEDMGLPDAGVSPRCLEELLVKDEIGSASFLCSILSSSQESLRVVFLREVEEDMAEEVFSALGNCPRLEHVSVPMSWHIEALSACPAISTLELWDPLDVDMDEDSMAPFLRSLAGSNLRTLAVSSLDVNVLVPAVKCLTQLTALTLKTNPDVESEDEGDTNVDVADLLACLPCLETLHVSWFPNSARDVRAVTPNLAPGLRLLHVRLGFNDGRPHEALDQLCSQRPLLRIQGHAHYASRRQ